MLLLLLAATANPTPPVAKRPARVSIRILQPGRVSERLWRSAPRRSERLILDEQGRKLRLRTVDFE